MKRIIAALAFLCVLYWISFPHSPPHSKPEGPHFLQKAKPSQDIEAEYQELKSPEKELEKLLMPRELEIFEPERSRTETAEEQEVYEKEKEAYLLFRIKKHPDNYSYFTYAEFLFRADRFQEAKRTLDICLQWKTCYTDGGVLKTGIEQALAAKDPDALSEIKSQTNIRLLEAYLPASTGEVTPSAVPVINHNLELEKKPRCSSCYLPPYIEQERLFIVQSYEADFEPEKADQGFKRLLEDYSDSPFIHLEYIRILIHRNKISAALDTIAQVEESYPTFKDEPEWKILTDTLKESSGKSANEIAANLNERIQAERLKNDPRSLMTLSLAFPVSEPLAPDSNTNP